MNRFAIRAAIAAVAAIIGGIIHFSNKSSSSDEFRRKSHKIVATVDGYSVKPDYYDWLCDEAHDEVFDGAYHSERRGRYGEKSWVDRSQYLDELFEQMIVLAQNDKAAAVVESLEKFRAAHSHPEPK